MRSLSLRATFGAVRAAPADAVLDRFYPRVLGFAYQVLGDSELAVQAAEQIFVQPEPPTTELAIWKAAMVTMRSYVARGFVVRPLVPAAQGWQTELLSELAALPPLDRALLLLRYHEALEPAMLSEILGQPEAVVRAQIAAARDALIDAADRR